MLKCYSTAITFAEFPDEICLALNISNCPGLCSYCSEPWLQEDSGEPITENFLKQIILQNPGITLVGLMGGDADHDDVIRISDLIHKLYPTLKVGMYSGRDFIDLKLVGHLDYYKVGRWIMPEGPIELWKNESWGPLVFPNSNQKMWKILDGKMYDITSKFRKTKIYDLEKYIVK